MKFLVYEIILRAGFNLATGRFWPAGRMFDTTALTQKEKKLNPKAMITYKRPTTIGQ